jgi:hypothetical protein
MALALSGYATDNSTENGHQMSSIVPMIVKVIGDGSSTDVPVTPDTTCSDVIECCRDPGDETCNLVAVCPEHGECPLRETDHPLEILQRWGSGRLVLRYTVLSSSGGTYEKRNGMKEPDHFGETVSQFRRKYLTTIHSKAGLMDRPCPNIFTQLPRCTGPDRENYDTRQ